MKRNYIVMNEGSEVTIEQGERILLRKVMDYLPESTKQKIRQDIEEERARLERTSAPGHVAWYDVKLAVCAAMQKLSESV